MDNVGEIEADRTKVSIVFDDIIFSLQKAGGISTWWKELVTRCQFGAKHIVYKNSRSAVLDGLPAWSLMSTRWSWLLPVTRYLSVRTGIKQPHIFHSSYYRFARDHTAINVTTVHDFTYERFRTDLVSRLHKWQKRRAVMRSKGVICNSQHTLKDFRQTYPAYNGLAVVILHGYSKDYVATRCEKKPQVVFVGARDGYKRFDLAMKIVSRLPSLSLFIVGGGELTSRERRDLDGLIPDRYVACGYLSNSALCSLYAESLYLLYTSDYEGFGIPVLEAQASGCPVICQKTSSLIEVAGDAAVFFEPTDVDNLVSLVKSIANGEDYRRLVDVGLANVRRFSWDLCMNETFQFYKTLLSM